MRMTAREMRDTAQDLWHPGKIECWRKVGDNTCRYNVVRPGYPTIDVIQLRRTAILIRMPSDVAHGIPEQWQINLGGWPTVTTRARINKFLPYMFRVTQRNHDQYVWCRTTGQEEKFVEGAIVVPESETISTVW